MRVGPRGDRAGMLRAMAARDRIASRLGIVAAVALAACYEPKPPTGAPCEVAAVDSCPSGQACLAGYCCEPAATAPLDAQPAGASPPVDCASADTCLAAPLLGTVSGDTDHQVLTATGSRAAWYRVRATENDSTLTGRKMRIVARLASPASAAFDVRIYLNAAMDAVECATPIGGSATICDLKVAVANWGEDAFPNFVEDGRDVAIEIRPISGTCVATARWELTVEGNPP